MLPTVTRKRSRVARWQVQDILLILAFIAVGTPIFLYARVSRGSQGFHGDEQEEARYVLGGGGDSVLETVPTRTSSEGDGGAWSGEGGDEVDGAGGGAYSRANLRLDHVRVEMLSWKPRVMVLHDLLSEEEADQLIDLGRPRLKDSMVVDSGKGNYFQSKDRTSSGAFLTHPGDHAKLETISERLAWFTQIPKENAEDIQILRYQPTEEYLPHFDWFQDKKSTVQSGQRVVTVLMYLSDVASGGETIFPSLNGTCTCGGKARKGLSVRPKKGKALVFWNLTPEGRTDTLTLHGGCPVVEGEKWSATRWIRQRCVGQGCNA